jgi:hypothetical protein
MRPQTNKLLLMLSAAGIILSGCATPMRYTERPMIQYDRDTEYAIEERQDGFTITIYYSRYQFIPESSAVASACRSALTSLAYDHADRTKRKIEPINEQRVRLSMGRNGFTGITSCSAQAVVNWQK